MYRFAALLSALLGFLVPASATAMDTKALEEYGLIPKSLETLGINHTWNLEETRRRFAEAGIRPKPPEELDYAIAGIKRKLEGIIDADGAPFPFAIVGLDEIPSECLFYENGIIPRHDVRTVAVCFANADRVWFNTGAVKQGENHQYLVAVAFSDSHITAADLKTFLSDIYGEAVSDGEFGWFWRERPWYYAGMLTKNYIYLDDHKGSFEHSRPLYEGTGIHPAELKGVSGVLYSANALGLAHFFSDLETALKQENEERSRATEEAEQSRRKGL